VEFNGQKVDDVSDLTNFAAITPPGSEVNLKIIQDGKPKTVEVKLQEFPEQQAQQIEEEVKQNLGLSVKELTPNIVRRFNIDQNEGVIISDIMQGSVAGNADLKVGDIIVEINNKTINNLDEYSAALKEVKPGDIALFMVKRGGNTLYAALRVPNDDSSDTQDK